MTLNQIDKDLLKPYFDAYPIISGRYEMGPSVDLDRPNTEYPRIFVIPQGSVPQGNVTIHTLTIVCADKTELDNTDQIKSTWSDTEQVLHDFYKFILNYNSWFDVVNNPNITRFLDQYADRYTGSQMTIQLQVDSSVGICDIPLFDPAICDYNNVVIFPTGPTGPHGRTGPQGPTGPIGPQGFQGYIGFQGTIGVTGSGFQGSQGNTGAQGMQGFQGIQGLQGYQGRQGFQGVSATGTQGLQGYQGFQGRQGFQGWQGPGTIQVTSLTMSQASWTYSAPFWNYTITNASILSDTYVQVIPNNANYAIVFAAFLLPANLSSVGQVIVYALNQPTGDIGVTINIIKAI